MGVHIRHFFLKSYTGTYTFEKYVFEATAIWRCGCGGPMPLPTGARRALLVWVRPFSARSGVPTVVCCRSFAVTCGYGHFSARTGTVASATVVRSCIHNAHTSRPLHPPAAIAMSAALNTDSSVILETPKAMSSSGVVSTQAVLRSRSARPAAANRPPLQTGTSNLPSDEGAQTSDESSCEETGVGKFGKLNFENFDSAAEVAGVQQCSQEDDDVGCETQAYNTVHPQQVLLDAADSMLDQPIQEADETVHRSMSWTTGNTKPRMSTTTSTSLSTTARKLIQTKKVSQLTWMTFCINTTSTSPSSSKKGRRLD